MSETIAVIGAGQMGNGIAHVAAQAGIPVTMIDVSADALAKGKSTIDKNLDRQVKKGAIDLRFRRQYRRRLARVLRLGTCVRSDAVSTRDLAMVLLSKTTRIDLYFVWIWSPNGWYTP